MALSKSEWHSSKLPFLLTGNFVLAKPHISEALYAMLTTPNHAKLETREIAKNNFKFRCNLTGVSREVKWVGWMFIVSDQQI